MSKEYNNKIEEDFLYIQLRNYQNQSLKVGEAGQAQKKVTPKWEFCNECIAMDVWTNSSHRKRWSSATSGGGFWPDSEGSEVNDGVEFVGWWDFCSEFWKLPFVVRRKMAKQRERRRKGRMSANWIRSKDFVFRI